MTVDAWRGYIYSRALGVSRLGMLAHIFNLVFALKPCRVFLWAKRGLAHFGRSPSTETKMLPVCLYTRCEKHPRKFQALDTSETMISLRAAAIYYFRTRHFLAPSRLFGGWTIARFPKGKSLTRMNQRKLENEILLFVWEFKKKFL